MIDERTTWLIHREIDGENSPAESERLRSILKVDAETRRQFDELRMTADLLTTLESVDPPADFHDRVMAKLAGASVPHRKSVSDHVRRQPASDRGPAIRRAVERMRSLVGAIPVRQRRLGYAFAVCTLVVLGLISVLPNLHDTPQSALSGTLAAGNDVAVPLKADGLSGTAVLRMGAQRAIVEFDLHTDAPVDLFVEFDEAHLAFSDLGPPGASSPELEEHPGELRLSIVEEQSFAVTFDRISPERSPSIEIRLVRDGEPAGGAILGLSEE